MLLGLPGRAKAKFSIFYNLATVLHVFFLSSVKECQISENGTYRRVNYLYFSNRSLFFEQPMPYLFLFTPIFFNLLLQKLKEEEI